VVVHRERRERLDTAEIANSLTAGDALFVDTTHTVKTGGDVDRIFLDLLPRLAPGVWVHVHDIFLPYEYPRTWVVDEPRAWASSTSCKPSWSSTTNFKWRFRCTPPRAHAQRLMAVVPSFSTRIAPGAFWVSRVVQ
jgi:hypothetical protein